MRMRTHDRQTMMTETSKTTNFRARFFYNIFYSPIQQYNVFLLARLFQAG